MARVLWMSRVPRLQIFMGTRFMAMVDQLYYGGISCQATGGQTSGMYVTLTHVMALVDSFYGVIPISCRHPLGDRCQAKSPATGCQATGVPVTLRAKLPLPANWQSARLLHSDPDAKDHGPTDSDFIMNDSKSHIVGFMCVCLGFAVGYIVVDAHATVVRDEYYLNYCAGFARSEARLPAYMRGHSL